MNGIDRLVTRMESKGEMRRLSLDRWIWRIAILSLPWQTRWLLEGPSVQGFPWEGGRMSFYASWIPIMACVILAMVRSGVFRSWPRRTHLSKTILIAIVCLAIVTLHSFSLRASFMWWTELFILIGFVWSIRRLQIRADELATWFVISVTPHAVLGISQSLMQYVHGSTVLGISAQDPMTLGVSVVERAGVRFLRAYGGFPHPNIFGAWLSIAILLAWRGVQRARRIFFRVGFLIALALCSAALVCTFSRGAWLAAIFGLGYLIWREMARGEIRRRWAVVSIVVLGLTVGSLGFSYHSWIGTRALSRERLEARSTNERVRSTSQGIELFLRHPLFGVGPGATAVALEQEGIGSDHPGPPIIPHAVPLLALVELGMLGFVGAALLAYGWIRSFNIEDRTLFVAFGIVFTILALTDHFLWSTWSGMGLLFIGPRRIRTSHHKRRMRGDEAQMEI